MTLCSAMPMPLRTVPTLWPKRSMPTAVGSTGTSVCSTSVAAWWATPSSTNSLTTAATTPPSPTSSSGRPTSATPAMPNWKCSPCPVRKTCSCSSPTRRRTPCSSSTTTTNSNSSPSTWPTSALGCGSNRWKSPKSSPTGGRMKPSLPSTKSRDTPPTPPMPPSVRCSPTATSTPPPGPNRRVRACFRSTANGASNW